MKNILTLLLIMLIGIPTTVQADDWISGCTSANREDFISAMGEERFSTACNALNTCSPNNAEFGTIACEFPIYEALVSECLADEATCHLQSSFYMASLLIYDPTVIEQQGIIYETAELREMMPNALASFQLGDYEAVIEMISNLPAIYGVPAHPMREFMVSLLMDKGLGNPEDSLSLYTHSIMDFRTPFVTYQRANFLAEQGFTDATAVEGLFLEQLTESFPLARPAAEDILTRYPVPEDLVEEWIHYPVEGIAEGPAEADLSVQSGEPIQLARLSDGTVLIIGLPNWLDDRQPGLILYDGYSYNHYNVGSSYIDVSFEENVATLRWRFEDIMWSGKGLELLGRADEPDPRVGRYERCEGGARWRFSVGDYGRHYGAYNAEYNYYDAPNGNARGSFSTEISGFRVIDGAVCIDGVAWWQINLLHDDSTAYWIPEAHDISGKGNFNFTYLYYQTAPPD